MLFSRLRTLTHIKPVFCLLMLTIPAVAMADPPTDKKQVGPAREILLAELAEDESVEDVEHSKPRHPTGDVQVPANEAAPESPAPKPEPVLKPKKVAPNIDLKDVAPAPAPEPPADPDAQDAPGSEEADVSKAQEDGAPSSMPATQEQETPEPEDEKPQSAKNLVLLESEVLPGTSTRLGWSAGIQIAGLSQPTPVLVVNGANAGPTLCLTSTIHGDELNGIEIIRQTMYDLDPEKLSGAVVGIPIVNLPGFQQGSRYLPDRRDLNRHFPGSKNGSLADRIANSLFEKVIQYCDMLVDIHTGSLKRTNLPQLRADMNNPAVAEFTRGFDRMAVVHSTGSPGMLRTAAVNAGIRAVTLEAGESHRIQEHQIDAGVNSLASLMEKQKMISRMFVWGDPEPVYYDSAWVRANHGGILFSKVELGAKVSKGEVLGYIADPITNAQYPIASSSDGRIIGMAVDQVVMAGFAAYHIGTKAKVPGE
ncbi:succinylglutamate desuccinylase/aspartoacylase family protein [Marinobacter sp. 1_MG-2023]|uniref:succinylglutamate desuccinylase/aspartoacylase family protein n=1 Tax=Marinobacter sp. 1_MG-2023 TaxID=3062627 RepID=UPI0026E1C056|nr:succinylglutamate desuccinylase/aspartoacylase family protein [Marinobacter sp. 1_MG-2023]MDO6822210.1 succinylglutamate desuccinylase/aspartoacylase family protein [Marinobacter sp. 1_MG-2023]